MKEYVLELPERTRKDVKNIIEYLMVCHYNDEIFTAGACAKMLNIKKYNFQTAMLSNFNVKYIK